MESGDLEERVRAQGEKLAVLASQLASLQADAAKFDRRIFELQTQVPAPAGELKQMSEQHHALRKTTDRLLLQLISPPPRKVPPQ